MSHVFELRGLEAAQDGYPVLRGLDFSAEAGDSIALLGPSGAGKTSLLRVLGATLLPLRGTAQVLGKNTGECTERDLRSLRSKVGFVHQDLALIPTLRVLQNILAGRLGRRGMFSAAKDLLLPSKSQKLAVFQLLEELGIGEKLFERTQSLSGGEQQRVALARALYQEPQLLLADEPVSAVDPTRSRSLLALLQQVARKRGIPLVVSLHQADLAREYFPRLVGMRQGQILFDRKTDEISAADLDNLYTLDGTPT